MNTHTVNDTGSIQKIEGMEDMFQGLEEKPLKYCIKHGISPINDWGGHIPIPTEEETIRWAREAVDLALT